MAHSLIGVCIGTTQGSYNAKCVHLLYAMFGLYSVYNASSISTLQEVPLQYTNGVRTCCHTTFARGTDVQLGCK